MTCKLTSRKVVYSLNDMEESFNGMYTAYLEDISKTKCLNWRVYNESVPKFIAMPEIKMSKYWSKLPVNLCRKTQENGNVDKYGKMSS